MGLSIKSIANKYSMTTKNIQYMLCLAEKHGIDILKKEKTINANSNELSLETSYLLLNRIRF